MLAPSYSWTTSSGDIVIARNQDGHFYLTGKINDMMVKFMVDTGASDVALTREDAVKIGYDLSSLDYNRTYSTANGTSLAAPIILPNIEIANAKFQNIGAHVSQDALDISLMGMSLISKFKTFKIDKDLLILSY